MPNIRSQRVDASGLYIQASNGIEFNITSTEIRNFFQSQVGNPTQRATITLSWLRNNISNIIGSGLLLPTKIDRLNFDQTTGRITDLRIIS